MTRWPYGTFRCESALVLILALALSGCEFNCNVGGGGVVEKMITGPFTTDPGELESLDELPSPQTAGAQDTLYFVWTHPELVVGDVVTTTLLLVDVPPNVHEDRPISVSDVTIAEESDWGKAWYEPTEAGWRAGTYRIEVTVNNVIFAFLDFEVSGQRPQAPTADDLSERYELPMYAISLPPWEVLNDVRMETGELEVADGRIRLLQIRWGPGESMNQQQTRDLFASLEGTELVDIEDITLCGNPGHIAYTRSVDNNIHALLSAFNANTTGYGSIMLRADYPQADLRAFNQLLLEHIECDVATQGRVLEARFEHPPNFIRDDVGVYSDPASGELVRVFQHAADLDVLFEHPDLVYELVRMEYNLASEAVVPVETDVVSENGRQLWPFEAQIDGVPKRLILTGFECDDVGVTYLMYHAGPPSVPMAAAVAILDMVQCPEEAQP